MSTQLIKPNYQGYISLSTHYLEYGRHVARLHRRRRRAYAPTSNTASHDDHEKINSWVPFVSHIWDAYGAPLGGGLGPPELRYSFQVFYCFTLFLEKLINILYKKCRNQRSIYIYKSDDRKRNEKLTEI